jgi:hypothetical protein
MQHNKQKNYNLIKLSLSFFSLDLRSKRYTIEISYNFMTHSDNEISVENRERSQENFSEMHA